MADAYDFAQIDRAMSRRLDGIYSDPKRHRFSPRWKADVGETTRYGNVRNVKGLARNSAGSRVCVHCGTAKHGHAKKDDLL